jgi:RHS repeat-associated protein
LDYAAGSIGVDLLAPVKVTKIELQPNGPIHRVTKSTSIRLYISQDNITYTRLKDWKMVAKEKGKVEIVLDTAVTARFIKVKSMFDERDNLLNPVNQAQFMNVPQDLIHVYYLMNTRQEEYSYDKVGNRLTETVTQRYPVSRTYSYYPNSSRLKSNGKYNFEYDSNGNLTKKETLIGEKIIWEYEYDLFNRLVKVKKNDRVIAEYMYDEAGLRIKKQGPQSQIYYVFDSGGNVLYEQENREYMEYVYVLGKHFARIDGNLDNGIEKKYFYHTDHLGSTVLVTDETGKQVWSAEYTPFGKQVSKEGEMDHVTKFTGKDLDEDTGLYYFNARWYDQEVGRFVSEDPGKDPNSPNLYAYCWNNPLTVTDPTGMLGTNSVSDHSLTELSEGKIEDKSELGRYKQLADNGVDRDQIARVLTAEKVVSGFKWEQYRSELTLENQIQIYQIMQALKAQYRGPDGKINLWDSMQLSAMRFQLELAFKFQNGASSIGNLFRSEKDKWGPFYTAEQIDAGIQNTMLLSCVAIAGVLEMSASQSSIMRLQSSIYSVESQGFGKLEGIDIKITQKGLDLVRNHLSKFDMTPENQAMIERLENALKNGTKVAGADASFYMHEAAEYTLMSKGMSYEAAHAASIAKYQVSPFSLYAPEVVKNNPELFNDKWFEFWGISN